MKLARAEVRRPWTTWLTWLAPRLGLHLRLGLALRLPLTRRPPCGPLRSWFSRAVVPSMRFATVASIAIAWTASPAPTSRRSGRPAFGLVPRKALKRVSLATWRPLRLGQRPWLRNTVLSPSFARERGFAIAGSTLSTPKRPSMALLGEPSSVGLSTRLVPLTRPLLRTS